MTIQSGLCRGKAYIADLGMSGTGKDQVAIQFNILNGPNEGQRITWYGFFTENSVRRTLESLRNCGFEGYELNVLDGTPETTARLLPNEVELDVSLEEYDGKERAKVNWVNPGTGRFLREKMDSAQKVDFASRMKGTLMALEQNGGVKDDMEDVPFK